MYHLTPKELKKAARQRLSAAAYPYKKLTLWYSGIVLGLGLLSVILQWVTGMMMESAGGLSGMNTRAILDTVSTVFAMAVQIVTPLLTLGFLYCSVRFARQENPQPNQLLMGLRRWAVILRHGLLIGLIFLTIAYLAVQIASIVFTFLPSSAGAMELIYAMMEDPTLLERDLSDAELTGMLRSFAPVYIIAGSLFIAAFIPVCYRLRLSSYRIMEDTPVGAVKAVLQSAKMMKGNCIALFKLDLSFWWFYVLQVLLVVVMNGIPLLLPAISEPLYVLLCAGYSVAALVLEYHLLAYVQTTYALFHDILLEQVTTPQIEE